MALNTQSSGDLGELIYEKHLPAWMPWLLFGVGAFFIAIGVSLWFDVLGGTWHSFGLRTLFGMFALVPIGFALILAGVWILIRGRDFTSVFEHGVENRRRGKTVTIPFSEVIVCCYHEHCWREMGTATLEVYTEDGRTIKVTHDFTPRGEGEAKLKKARDVARRVTGYVQRRMEAMLKRGESVEWVGGWNLHADGLKRAADGKLVPWGKIDRSNFKLEGETWFCTIGGKLRIDVDDQNFWPGYAILKTRVEALGIPLAKAR